MESDAPTASGMPMSYGPPPPKATQTQPGIVIADSGLDARADHAAADVNDHVETANEKFIQQQAKVVKQANEYLNNIESPLNPVYINTSHGQYTKSSSSSGPARRPDIISMSANDTDGGEDAMEPDAEQPAKAKVKRGRKPLDPVAEPPIKAGRPKGSLNKKGSKARISF